MSQNSYNTKIVESLLQKDNHIRGLAKDLNINQMTISRRINGLYKENVASGCCNRQTGGHTRHIKHL